MKRTNFYIPAPLLQKMKEKAAQSGYSVSELVRKALEAFLK